LEYVHDKRRLLILDDAEVQDDEVIFKEAMKWRREWLPNAHILAVGSAKPSGPWHGIALGPINAGEVLAEVRRGPTLSNEALVAALRLTRGNPALADALEERLRAAGGGELIRKAMMRSTTWTDRDLLAGVGTPAVAAELDIRLTAVGDALIEALAARPELLHQLRPRQFEELMAELYSREGFEVELTPPTRDGGVDLFLIQHTAFGRLMTVVDCKRTRADRPVGVAVVRQMLGTVDATGASAGVLATTSRFTRGAYEMGARYPFRLALQDYFALHTMLRKITSRE
jgi:restriction system protein